MNAKRIVLVSLMSAALAACSTFDVRDINLPEVNFMGESDFSEDVAQLDPSYPRPEETPEVPTDVRNAAEWDATARDMQQLYDLPDAPEAAPSLSEEEFNAQFEAARAATKSYKADDPS
ncbi:MAG: hypothetical protein AAFP97_12105 [Pseudomonadota bacterium]